MVDNFDPDATGISNGNYFGFPFTVEQAALALLSVPWDVTASYGKGASSAPDAIIEASTQLDFYDPMAPRAWERGVATVGIDYDIQELSGKLGQDSQKLIEHLESGGTANDLRVRGKAERINAASEQINEYVYDTARQLLDSGKIVGLVGGDHSTPFGLIRAVAEREKNIGVLHLDAHRDLRDSYQGFAWSHASIMYNVMTRIPGVEKLVQVGVRDFSYGEQRLVEQDPNIVSFEDHRLAAAAFRGVPWDTTCAEIVETLPEKVYISFDIDALAIYNCPHTGTPVAGGIGFNQAVWLIHKVVDSGRRIVGFDLCEVAPGTKGELDADVGARMLFKLCGAALKK